MRRTQRTVSTADADIRVTESDGKGMPLLLLHGAGADHRVFDHQFDSYLAERHRLIAIDLPGHGESSDAFDPAVGYSLPGFARIVGKTMQTLGVDRAVVYGWSLGGHVAVQLMHDRPEFVAGLMLTGAPPVSRGPIGMLRGFHTSWDMLLASKEVFSARDVERYAQLCYGNSATPELIEAIRRTDGRARVFLSRSMMRGEGGDQRMTVEQATVPVALVNGEHDPLIRLSYVASLNYGTLWDGHTFVLENAGHAAFRDAPNRFNALLLRFAADCEAWGRRTGEMPTAVRTA
jgi:pimeloyl-ACP methyl ester carboxylesterase